MRHHPYMSPGGHFNVVLSETRPPKLNRRRGDSGDVGSGLPDTRWRLPKSMKDMKDAFAVESEESRPPPSAAATTANDR